MRSVNISSAYLDEKEKKIMDWYTRRSYVANNMRNIYMCFTEKEGGDGKSERRREEVIPISVAKVWTSEKEWLEKRRKRRIKAREANNSHRTGGQDLIVQPNNTELLPELAVGTDRASKVCEFEATCLLRRGGFRGGKWRQGHRGRRRRRGKWRQRHGRRREW